MYIHTMVQQLTNHWKKNANDDDNFIRLKKIPMIKCLIVHMISLGCHYVYIKAAPARNEIIFFYIHLPYKLYSVRNVMWM